jgi:RNase P subunit RPR2
VTVAAEIGFPKAAERIPGRPVRVPVRDLPPSVVRLCVGCGHRMLTDRERCEHCLVYGDSPPVELKAPSEPDVFQPCTQCGRQRWTETTPEAPVCQRCFQLSNPAVRPEGLKATPKTPKRKAYVPPPTADAFASLFGKGAAA